MDGPRAKKNTDLEVLRAVAIAFTLSTHLFWGILPKLGKPGEALHAAFQFWTGVDLFFAISGFIITTSLLEALNPDGGAASDISGPKNRRNFLQFALPFWVRRAFRLLPCAWLWIAITLILSTAFNAHGSFGALRNNLNEAAAALLNVTNFYYYEWFARHHSDYGSFGVFWSLSLEEQFYVLFPFLLFFVGWRRLVPVLLCVFFAQAFVARPSGFTPQHPSLLWFIRTDALMLGVLIAFWRQCPSYRRLQPRFLRRRWIALPLVGLCVVALAAVPAAIPLAQFSTGLAAVLSGWLVLLASYDRHYIFPTGRLKPMLVWLGARSYGIYLIHVTCRSFILELKKASGVAEGSAAAALGSIVSVIVILLLAELNYRWVEAPCRKLGRRVAASLRFRLPSPATAPEMLLEEQP